MKSNPFKRIFRKLSERVSAADQKIPLTTASRGMALVLVMGMIVLCSALVVAFFLIVRTSTTSVTYSASKESASELAASAVQIVEGTISHATDYHNDTTFAWASQPGMIRTYGGKANGSNLSAPLAYYKLYSANNMVVSGSALSSFNFSQDLDSNWDKEPACFVDLNAPILVSNTSGSGNGPIFPVVDPRAMDMGVQGFNYSSSLANSSIQIDGVNNTAINLMKPNDSRRLPMPVRWIYVLRDGSFIAPDSGGSTEATFKNSSVQPSSSNPIVGRLAFWTDDDCSKINVNTASEGTYWANAMCEDFMQPTVSGNSIIGEGQTNSAVNLPAPNEFQSYPGHPATTCLSVVFGSLFNSATRPTMVDTIADAVPRIVGNSTSSEGGTQNSKGMLSPDGDRLYANIDEFPFSATSRAVSSMGSTISLNQLATFAQSCRFFLTANSKASDLNLFGLPKVSIWPIWDDLNSKKRTAFDQEMLRCSTIGSGTNSSYLIFSRDNPNSSTVDVTCKLGNQTNQQLYEYLRSLTSIAVPGFGGKFSSKYNRTTLNGVSENDQILAEIADYIRCTNLADGNIPTGNPNALLHTVGNLTVSYTNTTYSANKSTIGMVVPIKITPNGSGGTAYGFGRVPMISELALVFCKIDDRKASQASNTYSPPSSSAVYPDVSDDSANQVSSITVNGFPDLSDSGTSTVTINTGKSTLVEWALVPKVFCPMAGWTYLPNNFRIHFNSINFTISGNTINYSQGNTPSVVPDLFDLGRFDCARIIPSVGVDSAVGANIGYASFVNQNTSNATVSAAPAGSMYPTGLLSIPVNSVINVTAGDVSVTLAAPGCINGTNTTLSSAPWQQTYDFKFPTFTLNIPSLPFVTNSTSNSNATVGGVTTQTLTSTATWYGSFRANSGCYVPPTSPSTTATFNYPSLFSGTTANRNSTRFNSDMTRLFGVPGKVNDAIRSLVATGTTVGGLNIQGDLRLIANVANLPNSVFALAKQNGNSSNSLRAANGVQTNTGNHFAGGTFLLAVNNYTNSRPSQGPEVPWGITQVSWENPLPGTPDPYTGDWDNGPGLIADGPYLNKPNDGNYPVNSGALLDTQYDPLMYNLPVPTFSPYMQVSSPVMFGSLPAGGITPWRTLLFRPANLYYNTANLEHPGGPIGANAIIPDHLLLDLFRMPVVQPYSISNPFQTAGKINLNCQIAPFTYITRNTGLQAIFKSVMVSAIGIYNNVNFNRNYKLGNQTFPYESNYPIDANQTLAQFYTRFGGLNYSAANPNFFVSSSQICDIPLIPVGYNPTTITKFWNNLAVTSLTSLTGDNLLERPYSYIYPRVTTQSNTFTVHVRAQSLKKIASDPNQAEWNEDTDLVTGEYRGSYTIERYFDPNTTTITDAQGHPVSLSAITASSIAGNNPPAIRGAKWRIVAAKQWGQ